MRLLIVIPAYNEEKNIPLVAEDLGPLSESAILIDDGSSDGTGETARRHGFEVAHLPYNVGIGGAVQTGLMYALENGYDAAVQFDGDHQHRADQIEAISDPVLSGRADMVVGSRVLAASTHVSLPRRLGGRYFSIVLRLLTGLKITDPTSGFRCYGPKALKCFSCSYPEDYPEVESLLSGSKMGLRIIEVPAGMRKRSGGKSSINAFRALYYMVKVTISLLIGSLRSRESWRC